MKNVKFVDFLQEPKNDKVDLILGLTNRSQKHINPKYFYDEKGSKLFEEITNVEDYYPTKKEMEIFNSRYKLFQKILPKKPVIIEFGSGSNKKITKLLEILNTTIEYISIDISKKFLLRNAHDLAKRFPELKVKAICADLNCNLNIPSIIKIKKPKIGFFPGSTIGNFCPDDAKKILKKFARLLDVNNFLIIGVDLIKNKKILEKAYNDDEGITAKFNKNIFSSINKKYGSNFNKDNFDHNAFFNSSKDRIEMHLISNKLHSVNILDKKLQFKKGESIHTENSYKYTYSTFEKLVNKTNFVVENFVTDSKEFFGIFILKVLKK